MPALGCSSGRGATVKSVRAAPNSSHTRGAVPCGQCRQGLAACMNRRLDQGDVGVPAHDKDHGHSDLPLPETGASLHGSTGMDLACSVEDTSGESAPRQVGVWAGEGRHSGGSISHHPGSTVHFSLCIMALCL